MLIVCQLLLLLFNTCPTMFFFFTAFLTLNLFNEHQLCDRDSVKHMYIVSFMYCLFFFGFYFLLLLFLKTSLLEYNCFTMVCQFLLYNKMNQLYITYIPISPPSCISLPPSVSHPFRRSQSTKLISLCYAAASHYLFYTWQYILVIWLLLSSNCRLGIDASES